MHGPSCSLHGSKRTQVCNLCHHSDNMEFAPPVLVMVVMVVAVLVQAVWVLVVVAVEDSVWVEAWCCQSRNT